MQFDYAGSSLKQIVHFAQLTAVKHFRYYDYGKKKNLKIYGSELPPNYNTTKVVVPVAYYYGKHDLFIPPEDQMDAIKLFPNVIDDYLVPYSKFTHLDMLLGNDAAPLVYKRALKLMKKY